MKVRKQSTLGFKTPRGKCNPIFSVRDSKTSKAEPSGMVNHKKFVSCDVLKTKRIIINDNLKEHYQQLPNALPTQSPLFYPESVSLQRVQFSSTFLTSPKFSDAPINPPIANSAQTMRQNTTGRYFNNYFNNDRPFEETVSKIEDDDVICLDSSPEDNFEKSESSDSSVIIINDSEPTPFTLSTNKKTLDLSKFSITITNPECTADLNDTVICIDSPNETEATQTEKDSNIITIEDDTDMDQITCQQKCFRFPKKKSKGAGAIFKKKDIAKKVHKPSHTKKAERKYITFNNKYVTKMAIDSANSESKIDDICVPKKKVRMMDDLMESTIKEAESKTSSEPQSLIKSVWDNIGSNVYINHELKQKSGLREIVIDGSNVALGHSNGTIYSIEGLQIVIDYFVKRGHKVRAFVPKFRLIPGRCSNPELLRQLVNNKQVILTPSRSILGKRITPYDDRFIIQYATLCKGVIVSSDCYRDLINEKPEWRNTIENRLLMPTWIDNILMFPEDPLGRFGPNLTDFLKFPDP